MAQIGSTEHGIQSFCEWLTGRTKKEQSSFVQAVKHFFERIAEVFNSLVGRSGFNEYQRSFLQMQEQQLQDISNMWLSALDTAINNSQQKNNTADSSAVKYALQEYSQKQIENWKDSKKIFIYQSQEQLQKFIDDARNHENLNKKMYFGIINNATADFILKETGVDVHNYNAVLRADSILKIFDSHGAEIREAQRGQRAITDNDILLLPQLFGEIDFAEYKGKYTKMQGNNDFINVKSSIDPSITIGLIVQDKMLDIRVQTMYATKKGNNAAVVNVANKQPLPVTSETYSRRVSNTNVSQNNTDVNKNSMQGDAKYSLDVDSEGNKLSEEQIKRYKNIASELRDESGRIKPFYHGTARADRVGNYFNPDRATSGPMAYFTDNADIAGNYSRDKSDTSLAYDTDYDSYETQFRVNGKSITDYWYTLSPSVKQELTQKIQQITLDDDDNIVLRQDNKYGIGNFNDYELRMAKGNALQVLVDGWLSGGTLWGEESRFIDVLNTIGITNAEYKDPDYREEKVYKVYLNITNPFNTDNISKEFISDLEDYVSSVDMSIYDKENAQADMWDKNSIDIYDWIDRLKDDFENGTTHAWTSIPDVVTDFLKEYKGYNGIIDKGGKQGGEIHTVAIPFYSNQIKNVDNTNPTDDVDIRYSVDIDDFDSTGYNIINTTGKSKYKEFKSEVMTWDNTRYLDEVRCGYLGGSFHIYQMLSNEKRDILVYKPKSKSAKIEYKNIRSMYDEGMFKGPHNVIRVVQNKRNNVNDNFIVFGRERERYKYNDRLNHSSIREDGNSYRRRTSENDSNDNLQERRYEINVEQEIRKLRMHNEKLKLIREIYNKESTETGFGRCFPVPVLFAYIKRYLFVAFLAVSLNKLSKHFIV